MPNVMINTRGVRPIALDGDEGEPLLLDELARNALAHAIELRGAMCCLAEQDDARITDPPQQRIEVGGIYRLELFTRFRYGFRQRAPHRFDGGAILRRDGTALFRRPAFLADQRNKTDIREIIGLVLGF